MADADRRCTRGRSPWLGLVVVVVVVASGACGEGDRSAATAAARAPKAANGPRPAPLARPAAICGTYRAGGNVGLPPDTTGDTNSTEGFEAISGPEGEVGANSSASYPVLFEGSDEAALMVFADRVDGLEVSFAGIRLEPTDLLGAPVLQASLRSPEDGEIQVTNSSSSSTAVAVIVLVKSARKLIVTIAPESTPAGRPINIKVELSEPSPKDSPCALVKNEDGVETQVDLERTGPGAWTATYVPHVAGGYLVDVWVAEPRPRFAGEGFLAT